MTVLAPWALGLGEGAEEFSQCCFGYDDGKSNNVVVAFGYENFIFRPSGLEVFGKVDDNNLVSVNEDCDITIEEESSSRGTISFNGVDGQKKTLSCSFQGNPNFTIREMRRKYNPFEDALETNFNERSASVTQIGRKMVENQKAATKKSAANGFAIAGAEAKPQGFSLFTDYDDGISECIDATDGSFTRGDVTSIYLFKNYLFGVDDLDVHGVAKFNGTTWESIYCDFIVTSSNTDSGVISYEVDGFKYTHKFKFGKEPWFAPLDDTARLSKLLDRNWKEKTEKVITDMQDKLEKDSERAERSKKLKQACFSWNGYKLSDKEKQGLSEMYETSWREIEFLRAELDGVGLSTTCVFLFDTSDGIKRYDAVDAGLISHY